MAFAAGRELDRVLSLHVRKTDQPVFAGDRRIVEARAAAPYESPRRAAGVGKSCLAKKGEGRNTGFKLSARNLYFRQSFRRLALLEG